MIITEGNNKCRIFIKDLEQKSWQLFSLEQNKNDGSIYLGSPEFTKFQWLTFEIKDSLLNPIKIDQDKDGHLSFHGSGNVHVKNFDEKYKLELNGNFLLKKEENSIGLRHLFSMFPKQPNYIPSSPALNRKSDQVIQSNQSLKPFVIVALALPRIGLKLNFQTSFNINDMESIPGDFLGTHIFSLIHHDIFLFFYRTKNMNDWPSKTMIQYSDGFHVPLFFGEENKKIRFEFKQPSINLIDKELTINL